MSQPRRTTASVPVTSPLSPAPRAPTSSASTGPSVATSFSRRSFVSWKNSCMSSSEAPGEAPSTAGGSLGAPHPLLAPPAGPPMKSRGASPPRGTHLSSPVVSAPGFGAAAWPAFPASSGSSGIAGVARAAARWKTCPVSVEGRVLTLSPLPLARPIPPFPVTLSPSALACLSFRGWVRWLPRADWRRGKAANHSAPRVKARPEKITDGNLSEKKEYSRRMHDIEYSGS